MEALQLDNAPSVSDEEIDWSLAVAVKTPKGEKGYTDKLACLVYKGPVSWEQTELAAIKAFVGGFAHPALVTGVFNYIGDGSTLRDTFLNSGVQLVRVRVHVDPITEETRLYAL